MRFLRFIILLLPLLCVDLSAQTSILTNGGFESPIAAPWTLDKFRGAQATLVRDTVVRHDGVASAGVTITTLPAQAADLQLRHNGLDLTENATYTVEFWARSTRARTITLVAQRDLSPYENAGLNQSISLTSSWQQFSFTFTSAISLPSARVAWILGIDTATVWIDSVALKVKVKGAIDTTMQWQEITGFGASEAFFAGQFKDVPAGMRDTILDLLFTPQGADLSILRLQVEPKWDYHIWHDTVDPHQYWLIQEAKARGLSQFLASPWSPPGKYKANGKAAPGVANDPLNYLLPDSALAYAKHLSRYLRGYDTARDVQIQWLSLQNEANYNPKHNSCLYTPAQLTSFLRTLGPQLDADGVHPIIMAPEGTGWDFSYPYVVDILGDTVAGPYLDITAVHGYSLANDRAGIAAGSIHNGLGLWQTEWSDLSPSLLSDSLLNGLVWAERIHTDLTVGYVSAWLYWLFVSIQSDANEGLIRVTGGHALPYAYTVAKRLWAVAHYSRFIKPGSRRVDVTNGDGVAKITAFLPPTHDTLIVVAVNNRTHDTKISFALQDRWGMPYTAHWYRTSAAGDMVPGAPFQLANDSLTATLPARSITTYLIPLVGDIIEEGAPYADEIRPLAAAKSDSGNTVTFDTARSTYHLRVGSTAVDYLIAVGSGTDAARGVLSIASNQGNLTPVLGAGFSRRTAAGALLLPFAAADSTTVNTFTHAADASGVTLNYTETYNGLQTTKRYRVELAGQALRVAMSGDSTVPLAANNYFGMYPGRLRSAAAKHYKATQIPGHEQMPVTIVDNTRFVLTALDFTQSSATAVRPAYISGIPHDPMATTANGIAPGHETTDTTFYNAWRTEYSPDNLGYLPATPRDVMWVVISNEISDCFMKSTAPPSPERGALNDKAIVTLYTGGDSLTWWETNRRWLDSMQSYGIEGLAGYLFNWSFHGFNINEPTYVPPNPAGGSLTQFTSMTQTAQEAGYLLGLFTTFWIMDQGYDTLGVYLPNWNYVESDCNRAADGTLKRAWNTAANVPWGHWTRVMASTKSKPHIDRELGWIASHYDASLHYQDVVGAWLPDDDYLDQTALSGRPRTLRQGIAEYKKQWLYEKSLVDGPMISEGAFGGGDVGFDSWYGGYLDGVQRNFGTGYTGSDSLIYTSNYFVIPDFELLCVVPTQAGQGGSGLKGRFFDNTLTFPLSDAKADHLRAHTIAFGHAASISTNGDVLDAGDYLKRADQVKECYMVSECLQERYMGSTVDSIGYWNGTAWNNLSRALTSGMNLHKPRLYLRWTSGLEVWLNFSDNDWSVTTPQGSFTLPKHGWVATQDSTFLEFSAKIGIYRVDYVNCPGSYEMLDGRGRPTTYGGLTSTNLKVEKANGLIVTEDSLGKLTVTPPGPVTRSAVEPGAPAPGGRAIACTYLADMKRLRLEIPRAMHVTVRLFDLLGRELAMLADADFPAGRSEIDLAAEPPMPHAAPSGIYIVQITTPDGTLAQPIVLVR